MNLINKNIAIISAFEAPYGGNFIKMLIALGNELTRKGAKPYFIFPEQKEKDWIVELKSLFTIRFTRKPYRKSTPDLLRLFKEWHIDLVHTHFEAYDIPTAKAIKKINYSMKMVWHLHDNITLDKPDLNFKFIRKVGTNLRFFYHWGLMGRNAYFLPVCKEVGIIESHYRKHIFSFPPEHLNVNELKQYEIQNGEVVLNGIDINRIKTNNMIYFPNDGEEFVFLTFGGHTFRKGIPTILKATEILYQKKLLFKMIITKGVGTEEYIKQLYHTIPPYLQLVEQREDVNTLFEMCHCFISAALKETMSMAIAEASIYGLPIIQSDIPGTWWNVYNPSTFLFQVNDAEGLAHQMESVIYADKYDLLEKTRVSSNNNKNMLSMDNWCKKIIEIYERV